MKYRGPLISEGTAFRQEVMLLSGSVDDFVVKLVDFFSISIDGPARSGSEARPLL